MSRDDMKKYFDGGNNEELDRSYDSDEKE